MREYVIYRTCSWGGTEGRDCEIRNFETEEAAKANAIKDTWNDCFTLYKVTVTMNGIITETKEKIGNIECGRDIMRKVRG